MGIKLIKPENNLQLQAKDKEQLTFKQEKVLKGDPGDSAYDIAIANGFEGTEQEWLKSLEGAPGQTGPTGAPGKDGRDGVDGKDGYTPIKGIDYFDGEPGIDGKDGAPGEDGKDGISVTVAAVVESTVDGGFNVVTFSDGKTLNIKNGNKGADGKDGAPGEAGYTPVKGVDYFDGVDGAPGKDGSDGAPGKDGKDGYTPQKGIDYFDGEPGKDGAPGKDGKDGADGYTPIKGVDYFDGEPGAPGKDGEPGKDGAPGKDGYTPVKGVDYFDGEPGAPGKDGKDGEPGKDGYTPVKGKDYFDGVNGKDGYTPVKGVDYFDGKDGKDGVDGKNGTDGKNGVDGKNAYQYAQDGGYTGSETEFSAKLATPFVTPQMFKAPTDKDDTAALQRALAASDTVYLPSGQYVITETIDLTNRKSLVGSDNQGATLIYDGVDTDSVVLIGLETILRNINITVKKAFKGAVLDTHNLKIAEGTSGLNSKVEHVTVTFEQRSPEGTLIQILVDSGSDVNNMPAITGVCYQTYNDIYVSDASRYYGTGIKILLVQNRAFTEETKQGFPWVTHVDFDDVYLGQPYTAIKAGVDNRSGTEYFNRINTGHVLFNNVYTQYYTSAAGEIRTRYFFDVDHFEAFLTKCIAWDYHHIAYDYNLKANKIGENVNLSLNDCEMNFGVEFLESCDFTAETDSGFTVEDSPSYFTQKYFKGTFLRKGYDSVDAKIDAKLASDYIGNVAEDKVNEILYSGYANVLENPLTQVKVGYGWSNSAQAWVYRNDAYITTVIIPVVKGGNIIRWASERTLSDAYNGVYFFNEDLTTSKSIGTQDKLLFTDGEDTYLKYDNPSGYPYASIVFAGRENISPETMMMTINREITGESGESFTEYLKKSVIDPAIEDKFAKVDIPTSTSQLTNDSGFITAKDIPQIPDLSGYALKSNAETWTFTLADGSTVTKKVVLA